MTHPSPPDPASHPRAIPSPEIASESDVEAALRAIAPYYQLDMGGLQDDLPLYREYARAAVPRTAAPGAAGIAPRVLEIGLGTGRVAADLQAHGCHVVGLDSSPAMIGEARAHLRGTGVTIILGDIRRPPAHPALVADAFDLVIVPLSGLCHLLTRRDQQHALRSLARFLRPGGLFLADLPAFQPDDWRPDLRTPQLQWTRTDPRSGHTIMKYAAAESFPGIQIQQITYMYDELRSNGGVHRSLAQFPLRHIFRFELEGLLEAAGLPVERCYASYDLDDVQSSEDATSHEDTGDRLIVLARKPDPAAPDRPIDLDSMTGEEHP